MFLAAGLACAQAGVPVVAGIDLALAPGEIVVVRGPNGIGKTTLLRTCAGLQPAFAGRIDGQDRAVFASHRDGVKAALTVTENLTFWADVYRRRLPDDIFTAFGLETLRNRLAGMLSAGQARRLGLARLMAAGRPVLLLDEPTVSLDSASVALFAAFVGRHVAHGGAALIATHLDLGLAASRTLDLANYAAKAADLAPADEAFL